MNNEFDEIKLKLSSKIWKNKQQGFKDLQDYIKNNDTQMNITLREWAKYLDESNSQNPDHVLSTFKSFLQKNEDPFDSKEGMEMLLKSILNLKPKQNSNLINECIEEIFQKYPKDFINALNKILCVKSQSLSSSLLFHISELLNLYGPNAIGFDFLIENIVLLLKDSSTSIGLKGKINDFFKEIYKFLGNDFNNYIPKIVKPYSNDLLDYMSKNPLASVKIPVKTMDYSIEEPKKSEKNQKGSFYSESWINQVLEASTSWQKKKDMLEEFYENIANIPKNNYESLLSPMNVMLKRLMSDSNQNIVILAIKIIERIFVFFSKETMMYSKSLMQLLMEKFKDKKSIINEETHKALDSLKKSLNLDESYISNFFTELMDNKNPNLRLNALIFLNKIVSESNLEALISIFKKSIEDPNQEIREISFNFIKEIKQKFGEKKVKNYLTDLPSAKLIQIFKNNQVKTEVESSISSTSFNPTSTVLVGHNTGEENSVVSLSNEISNRIKGEKYSKKYIGEIFMVQELDFLRMSKKMRVFQTESKKSVENDQKAYLDIIKMQFTQVFNRSFRDSFFSFYEIKDYSNFIEILYEFCAMLNNLLDGSCADEKTIKDGLMKVETVSDLILKFLFSAFKIIIEKDDEIVSSISLLIIKSIQLLIKVLSHLKQNFLDFELRFIFQISILSFQSKFHFHLLEDSFNMLENLTGITLNSNKMTEFFLEEFRNSKQDAWNFRDHIIHLFANILIPKLNFFPLHYFQDFWEIISNRKLITNYKSKYPEIKNFPQYLQNFFDYLVLDFAGKKEILNFDLKLVVLSNIAIQPEIFDYCLDIMRNSTELSERIDSLLLLKDLAMSETKENSNLFMTQSSKFLITFLLTLRDFLIETQTSTQFPHFFLNCLQKFLASGLLDMSHSYIILLAEEILFVIVRNQNENIQKLLNLCLIRILSFGEIKLIATSFWNFLVKYSKIPCYSSIFNLITLSLLKILKRITEKDFPFFEIMKNMNDYFKQAKININNEHPTLKITKVILYQFIQFKGLEILEFCKRITDVSDNFIRLVNIISRPFMPYNLKNETSILTEEQYKLFEENINKLKLAGADFDETLVKIIDFCEQGHYTQIIELLNQIENENLKNYLKSTLERLFFIKKFPFPAQESRIFHKKLEKKSENLINPKNCFDYRKNLCRNFVDFKKNNAETSKITGNGIGMMVQSSSNNNNIVKNEEKTEDNLIYMLQRSEDYLENPALEDLCNPFSSKELIDDENLINFEENFSFTYADENILIQNVANNGFSDKNIALNELNFSKGNASKDEKENFANDGENCEMAFEEMESVQSEKCDLNQLKLTEIPENAENEEN